MKEIFKNKKLVLILIITLFLGGLVGWWAKPNQNNVSTMPIEHLHDETQVWTCSMHPQIRQSEPGQCPLCGMDLIPVSTKSGSANPMAYEMTPEAMAMANINTTMVSGVSLNGEVFLTGKVKPDEQRLASVTAKFPGRIEQLFVNFTGQEVRKGEKLATIYSPELITAQKELLEALSSKATFPELYQSARQKLKGWKLNDAQIDALEKTRNVNDRFDVFSDKSGVVTQRNVSVGDYVNIGAVLLEVVDLSRVWIMLDAYETDLQWMKLGNQVSFTVTGIPSDAFTGKITFIDPVINTQTRSAAVRVEIQNPKGVLKPEMFVNATVQTSKKSGGQSVSIPRTALLWSGKRSVVYVKMPDVEIPTFEMREITIGNRMGDMYEVFDGLAVGEEIVTNGVFSIDAAAQLAGKPSMMNPKGGAAMTGHDHGQKSGAADSEIKMTPNTPDAKVNTSEKTFEVPANFQNQLKALYSGYLPLKDALVASDAAQANKIAKSFTEILLQVDMKLVKGEAHVIWMEDLKILQKASETMSAQKDIEKAREVFSTLSDQLYYTIKKFQVPVNSYRQFCPMAMNNKGAFWLSNSEEIRNPYFGASMLTCGETKQIITSK
jgi:Cu(I)/Ag(I) efflux system membrane fusion protein